VLFVGALFPPAAQLPSGASPLVVPVIFAGLLALTTVYVLTALPPFQAQIAAQRHGERGLAQLATRYGADSVRLHGEALQAYSERMMRRLVEHIPPGTYRFSDKLDDDGHGGGPIAIHVAVTRQAGVGRHGCTEQAGIVAQT